MKTIIFTIQVKIDEDKVRNAEDTLDDIISLLETPIEDDNGPFNHLKRHGYEHMIITRSDK